jgi:hypothetical protein
MMRSASGLAYSRQITFAEADRSSDIRIFVRQRLRNLWQPIREQIALIA